MTQRDDDYVEPVLPDSGPAEAGKNIDPATEANLAFDERIERTDELIAAADVWLDEIETIEDEEMAGRAESFISQLSDHGKLIEAGRKAEKKVHDDRGKEVQERYRPQFAFLTMAIDKLKAKIQPWLKRKEREQEERAAESRRQAQEEQRKANEAARAAAEKETVAGAVAAEEAQNKAEKARMESDRVSRETAGVRGDYSKRKRSIRRNWSADIVDLKKAVAHYYRREEIGEVLLKLARQDAVASKGKSIPGFKVYQKESL